MILSTFDVAALLVVTAALLGYLNHHLLRLPHVIGLTVMGALVAIGLLAANAFIPGVQLDDWVANLLSQLDFSQTLLQGMLSFLLFAGALHVDLERLRRDWLPVLLLSTVGVLISTLLIGGALFAVVLAAALPLPAIWCFVFGALISPTDPVSVLGILKEKAVPPSLQAVVAGESLFNDGVGIVVFLILLASAMTGADFSIAEGAKLFAEEAGGGILLGLAIGWVGFHALRSMDAYSLEVLITIAVVMGGYAVAEPLHVSGPIAMAVAGLLIGNYGVNLAMSDVTRDYVIKFWELVDDTLNSILFLLIGLEIIAIVPHRNHVLVAAVAVPIALAARAISVWISLLVVPRAEVASRASQPMLVWGGLRGGISIALALSLPEGDVRNLLLAATFAVVLFSVLIQRATLNPFIERSKRALAGS
ncbi:MAG: sodium:proton antiporter [Sphingomonadales bacterium]|nr:sodium:proton antiporter [Sphingomonadales bacterium]MDE2567663.1 sodium:proton antiporter [Sphingomonadales bacterium]